MGQIKNKQEYGRYKPTILIITLNISGLSTAIKKQVVKLKIRTNSVTVYKKHTFRYTHKQIKNKKEEKIFHIVTNEKKAEVTILIEDKVGFRTSNVSRNKEGYYIIIKRSKYQQEMCYMCMHLILDLRRT